MLRASRSFVRLSGLTCDSWSTSNCAYQYYDAITFGRMIGDLDVFWFEEPVQPDDYEGMKKIAAAVPVTLAAGENEYTKYGFRDLIATQAVRICNRMPATPVA